MRTIRDHVVVVTGASSGIGRATALRLAGKGASLVLVARRDQPLQELADLSRDAGGEAIAAPADVTEADAVEGVASRAIEAFGRIDAWVNDAAVSLFGRLEEVPLADFRRVLDINLMGYVHGARAVLPIFREQGCGVLVQVSSSVGLTGQAYASAYAASKAAIIALSDSLRQELQDAPGVRVVTVIPSSIDTPIFQHAGNYSGREPKPIEPVYAPEAAARAIERAILRPRRELFVGGSARSAAFLHSLAPGFTERMMGRAVRRQHFGDEPAAPHAGNLREPTFPRARMRGGWGGRDGHGSGSAAVAAAIAVLGVGAGVAAWLARDRD